MTELLLLVLAGGLAGLDGAGLGQFMVSRPLVSAALGGWVLGDPAAGIAVGGLLELFHLPILPIGGRRLPEPGPASVAGGAIAASFAGLPGILSGVAAGLALAWAAGFSVGGLRRMNARLVPAEGAEIAPHRVAAIHTFCLTLDFVRGGILTGMGYSLSVALLGPLAAEWPLPDTWSVALILGGAALPLGTLLRALGMRGALLLFGIGGGMLLSRVLA